MKTEFVKLYNDELTDLRKKGEAFAEAHPKVASRLKIGQGNVEDPLVGRLLESFAFLTARLRHELQYESNALSENLLQLLYPHYFLPIPASSTITFKPADQLEKKYALAAGTVLSTPLANGDNCYFTTRYEVQVVPITATEFTYQNEITVTNKVAGNKNLKSCFSFTLQTNNNKQTLQELLLDSLRFFINASSEHAAKWYELFLFATQHIILTYGTEQEKVTLPKTMIHAVGFADTENLLPYPDNSFSGYRLLTEFFAYPEKFNYFELRGLNQFITDEMGNKITLSFYFDQYYPELEKLVNETTLLLHCTPVINLFEQSGEPIRFDHKTREYHLVANAQYSQRHIEVYNVNAVSISSARYKDEIDSAPYFGRQFTQTRDKYLYWHIHRKSCESLGEYYTQGDEVFLAISDFNLAGIDEQLILTPKLLCTNRDAPDHLLYSAGKPDLTFRDGAHELIANVQCVRPITPAKYRHTRQMHRTELASHIYVNQTGYGDPLHACQNLKNMLKLYGFAETFSTDLIGQGIVDVTIKTITKRHPAQLKQGFCRGLQYTIIIDEIHFTDHNPWLFGTVLQQFLIKSCSLNSFVELILTSKQRGIIATWPPLLGIKTTL